MRYYTMNFRRLYIIRMHEGARTILGWEFQWRRYALQIAWYWWGFGVDGGR
jgi:hypothetical protein